MFRNWIKRNKLKILQQHMQLPNDSPIWISIKSAILRKILVIFKVGYLILNKTLINQNGKIIAPYLLYWTKKNFFGNFLPTHQKIVSKMRHKKIKRKFSAPHFVLKSSSYQYLNFKNEFLGSKYLSSLQKSFKVKVIAKSWMWEIQKWLCSPINIHLVAALSRPPVKIFQTFYCYHHNFSVSITYVRISKIHD